jgi:hypothetical protein
MHDVNLIPARFRDARRRQRRVRAWITICGGYAIVLAVAYVGVATALGDGGTTSADLAKTGQQVESLNRAESMLKLQLRDLRIKLSVARTVGEQPDWSLLLAVLGQLTDERIVLRSCRLETFADARPAPAAAKAVSQPSTPGPTKMRLAITGLGKGQSDVTQFVLRLEKLGLFDHVDLIQSAREPMGTGEATVFRVECALHNRGSSER